MNRLIRLLRVLTPAHQTHQTHAVQTNEIAFNARSTHAPRSRGPVGIILLVALVASGLTGHYQHSVIESAKVDLNPAASASAPDDATKTRVMEAYGKLPMSFEANEGQTDKRVKFLHAETATHSFLLHLTRCCRLVEEGRSAASHPG